MRASNKAAWSLATIGTAFLITATAFAVDTVISKDAPDLTSPRAKIKAKDFTGALAELTPILATHQHADVYNLMGFSLRKSGDMKQAATFYAKALDFDPGHKGALEYQGEMYAELGQG
jgi:Flp pilus assembly protein TadD